MHVCVFVCGCGCGGGGGGEGGGGGGGGGLSHTLCKDREHGGHGLGFNLVSLTLALFTHTARKHGIVSMVDVVLNHRTAAKISPNTSGNIYNIYIYISKSTL